MKSLWNLSAALALAAAITGHACAAESPDRKAASTMPGMAKKERPQLGSSAVFAADGRLFAVARQGGHVLLHRSSDQGATWTAPVVVNAQPEPISADGENRPKLAFTRNGVLLVSWTKPLSKPNTGEIRLARAEDGEHFSAPITVHRNRDEITHRFESMLVAADGRVLLAWIDKRDLEKAKAEKAEYRGAAIYLATSTDDGRSFQPEQKLADHSCECCRIASASDADGTPLFMWRHVFEPNERDHALVRIKPDGTPENLQRATFDRWKLNGCPHHGPSLAVDDAGVKHAVWFNQKDGIGQVFYGRLINDENNKSGLQIAGQRSIGSARAAHADLVAAGQRIALVWKEFDGEKTLLRAELSEDGGLHFRALELASTTGTNDQARALLQHKTPYVFWHTENEGMRVFPLSGD